MSNVSNTIRHSGVIESVDGRRSHARVRILQTSACATCKAAGYCTSAESKEKIIDVYGVRNAAGLKVGDEVVVSASTAVAAQALLWAFGGPFLILVCALFALVMAGFDETLSALVSIAALIPYYLVLYLLRNHFRRNITFQIEGH